MEVNFKNLETEAQEIERFLAQPNSYADSNFAAKSRRLAEIKDILELAHGVETKKQNLKEAHEFANDPELGAVAQEDIERLTKEITADEAR